MEERVFIWVKYNETWQPAEYYDHKYWITGSDWYLYKEDLQEIGDIIKFK